ncbi:MAG TPA: DUF2807 domain-containing protein, partial [Rhizomicrobium sp.]|nr:DUF2807 domain-containing protein [Rhizomicrobium sp.]
ALADSNWMAWPHKTYDVHKVSLSDVVGMLTIDVKDGGPVALDVSGTKAALDGLDVSVDGGTLSIEGAHERSLVWDWRNWFNFSDVNQPNHSKLNLHLTVPKGTAIDIDDLVGNATIGDTMGRVDFSATATKTKIGHVTSAKVTMEGTGEASVAQVDGPLEISIEGSGKVTAGHAGKVKADLEGSGEAELGQIDGGLALEIDGSGSLSATKVNGPVKIEVAGAGDVKIADGVADPFHVEIAGAGDVYFGGLAVNPHVDAVGAGSVHIKSYRGHLDNEGMADVKADNKVGD